MVGSRRRNGPLLIASGLVVDYDRSFIKWDANTKLRAPVRACSRMSLQMPKRLTSISAGRRLIRYSRNLTCENENQVELL